jgi:hypothetical protein
MSWILLSSRGRELDHQISGHRPRHPASMPASVPVADFSAVCPLAGVLHPPGLAAGHHPAHRAARTYRAGTSATPGHARRSSRFPAQCSPAEADGTVTSGVAAEAISQGSAGRQDGVSDSDPRTLAEYVTHCPKIVVR